MGEEEFIFDKLGELQDRQVLLWPEGAISVSRTVYGRLTKRELEADFIRVQQRPSEVVYTAEERTFLVPPDLGGIQVGVYVRAAPHIKLVKVQGWRIAV